MKMEVSATNLMNKLYHIPQYFSAPIDNEISLSRRNSFMFVVSNMSSKQE
jgi:hypothetical protein